MKKYLEELFFEITGSKINDNKFISIKRFNYGSGLSRGKVCSGWWVEDGIPFLLERYKKIKYYFEGIDYEIKDIYWKSEHFKGSRNSFENAINRLLLFNELNLNNLYELLSIDESINNIPKESKEKIFDRLNEYKENNIIDNILNILNKKTST